MSPKRDRKFSQPSTLRGSYFAIAASLLALSLSACFDSGSTTARLGPAELAAEIRSSFTEAGSLDRARRLGVALEQLGPENLSPVRSVYDEYLHGLTELELRPFFE